MSNRIILHIDTKLNVMYIHLCDTDSVFEYSILKETWLYHCKHGDWSDYAPVEAKITRRRRRTKTSEK